MTTHEEDSPERTATSSELTQRFSAFFCDVEPALSVNEYDATPPTTSLVLKGLRRAFNKHFVRHEVTKQTVSKEVRDKKYLSGAYRTPDWGELVVEHILEDKTVNSRTGAVIETKPERYTLKFIDHSSYTPSNGVATKSYTSNDVVFSYEFVPSQQTVTAQGGRPMHFGDSNFDHFIKSLATAEEILS
jgi:hypothetical protein